MFRAVFCAIGLAAGSGAVSAQDIDAGAASFAKCQACHVVADADGEVLAGARGRVGPNLYGVVGNAAGMVDGFGYSRGLKAAGEAGLVWDEASFIDYLADPTKFLRDYLDDPRTRGAMSFRLRNADEAANVYAYLISLNPES